MLAQNQEVVLQMHRIRVATISAIAAFALTGLAQVAPASAHEFLIEGNPVTHYTKVGTSGHTTFILKGKPFLTRAEVKCHGVTQTDGIEPKGVLVLHITFTECGVEAPAHCSVKEVSFEAKGDLEETVNNGVHWLEVNWGGVESPPSQRLGRLTMEGSECSLKGKPTEYSGTGKCGFARVSEEYEDQSMDCSIAETHIVWGGASGTLETIFPELKLVNELGEPTHQRWGAI